MADYTTTASVVLTVNGKQAQEMLEVCRKRADELRNAISEAARKGDRKEFDKLDRELRKVRDMMYSIETASKSAGQVLSDLSGATLRQLEKELRHLRSVYKGLSQDDPRWKETAENIRKVKARIKELNEALKDTQSTWKRLTTTIKQWQASLIAGIGAITGMIMASRKVVDAFAAMEQEMANVRKYTGMTFDEVERLNEEFKKMDTRTSRENLNKLAQEAGRLGKTSVEDVLGFVRAADQINVALSDLGDGATLILSKLTGIFGDEKRLGTEKALLSVGSVINELSQNCAASAPYITDFTSRLGGVGAQAGMTVQQIMSFAAVLDSSQAPLEKSATALQQLIVKMLQEPAKYARAVGLEVQSFSELVKTDMNQALITFLESLSKAGKMDALAPLFADMKEKGSGTVTTLATLTDHIEELKNQQIVANQAYDEAISITNEFNVQNSTVAAGLDKSKKSFNELTVELGQKLMPMVSHVTSSIRLLYESIVQLVDFIFRKKSEIITVAGAIALYNTYLMATNAYTVAATKSTLIYQRILKLFNGIGPAVKLIFAGMTNAVQYFTNGLNVNYTMQQRWQKAWSAMRMTSWVGLILTVASAILILTKRFRDANKEAQEARKAQEAYRESIRNIDAQSAEFSAKELNRLEKLHKAAVDENLSKEERIRAVETLQKLYPDYFGNLNKEMIMAGEATGIYLKLRDAILETARARAAESKIEENTKELLRLEQEEKRLQERMEKAQQNFDEGRKKHARQVALASKPQTPGSAFGVEMASRMANISPQKKELEESTRLLEENRQQQEALKSANEDLANTYGITTVKIQELNETLYNPDDDGNGDGDGNKAKDRFEAEKKWRDMAVAEALISYRKGESDYLEYNRRLAEINKDYADMILNRNDLSEVERTQFTADFYESLFKLTETHNKRYLELEQQRINAETAMLKQDYLEGDIDKKTYDIRIEELEIEHQKNLVDILEEGSKERADADAKLQDMLISQMQKRQKEVEKLEAEYARIKDSYFGLNESERQAGYEKEIAALNMVYDREIAAAQGNADELVRIEEAKQLAILEIKKKYGMISEDEYKNSFESAVGKSVEWLNSDGGKAMTGAIDTMVSGMSAAFSQLSSYIQADLELQTAAIEKRYDKEIQRAEGNSYKVRKLEEQKEKEIADIKNEANRKMFAMQVIQAVAQTAQNALNAYGSAAAVPVVGYILAPIAAAMAVAAGAIQIASIKKQQQASEAQGYAEGGFTPKGPKDKEVGIVHAGEWVASQKLVDNPVTRPLIEALDYAQRTNTIGSISSRDVSRSITAPMVIAHGGPSSQPNVIVNVPENSSSNEELNNTLDKLNKRLDEPFYTVNTVTGEHGSKQAEDKYKRLMKNKSPKYKK